MLIELISCGNAEQVKLTTTKLMQNKEENKNSEFWNDNNEYPLHLEGAWRETKFNLLFFDRLMRRDARWPYKCLVKSTPFQREFDHEHATRSTTKLRENEKENKNSTV